MYGFYTKPPFWVGTQSDCMSYNLNFKEFEKVTSKPIKVKKINQFDISIYSDGLICFGFNSNVEENLKSTLKLIEYFNAFMFHIYNTINLNELGKKCSLDPYNVGVNDFVELSSGSIGFGDGTSFSAHQYMKRWSNPFVIQRVLFFSDLELDYLIESFEKCIVADNVWLYSYLNKVVAYYKNQLYVESFVLGFFLIEVLTNELWEKLISNNNENINSDRRKQLRSKDYTLAIKTNILLMNNVISKALASKLDNLRRKRNQYAHNVQKEYEEGNAYDDDFSKLFDVLNELIKEVKNIRIQVQGGYSYRLIKSQEKN